MGSVRSSPCTDLTDEGMNNKERKFMLQHLHWGMCWGGSPYIKLAHIQDYVVDIMHLLSSSHAGGATA